MHSSSSLLTAEQHPSHNGKLEITVVPSDVLQSNILPRLDGASLAALSCTCCHLHSFSSDESLWKEQCSATWPSILDRGVQTIISTFPAGQRSFFSDSFPFLANVSIINLPPSVDTTELISAVDIYYKDEVIFSKVHVTETVSGWFLHSPLRVDLVDPKVLISTKVSLIDQWEGDMWKEDLEQNLSLSWILIGPTRKRAVNISNRKPVEVHRHWLTGEVHVKFSTIFTIGDKKKSEEVEFSVTLVLASFSQRVEKTTVMQITEVSLVAEDMDGKNIGGKCSLVILTTAMGLKRRFKVGGEEEGKKKYKEFKKVKTAKAAMNLRPEKESGMETTACFVAVLVLGILLCFYLFIHKSIMGIVKKLMK